MIMNAEMISPNEWQIFEWDGKTPNEQADKRKSYYVYIFIMSGDNWL